MRKYNNLLFFAIGLMIGCLTTLLLKTNTPRSNNDDKPVFIFDGISNVDSIYYEYSVVLPPHEIQHASSPYYRLSEGAIPDARTAVQVALPVIYNVYGKEDVQKEQPYHVKFQRDGMWIVSGNGANPHGCGGTFSISLQKADGRISSIAHDK